MTRTRTITYKTLGRCQVLTKKGRCKNAGFTLIGAVIYCHIHFITKKSGTCGVSGG